MFFDYKDEAKDASMQQQFTQMFRSPEAATQVISAIRQDRADMATKSALLSAFFIAAAAGLPGKRRNADSAIAACFAKEKRTGAIRLVSTCSGLKRPQSAGCCFRSCCRSCSGLPVKSITSLLQTRQKRPQAVGSIAFQSWLQAKLSRAVDRVCFTA